jgi:hypothetical protein
MDIRGVKTDSRKNLRLKATTETQVPANTDSNRTEFPGADCMSEKKLNQRTRIVVIGLQGLVHLAPVSAIGSFRIIRENFSKRFELVKNLRHRHDEPARSECCGTPADWTGGVKYFGEKDNPWKPSFGGRTEQMRAHRTAWRGDIGKLVVYDGHCRRDVWKQPDDAQNPAEREP